jgi:hypothetical protein
MRDRGGQVIALVIIPLVWADPQSRKILVHDEGKPSQRFLGEDEEGFYSALQAVRAWDDSRYGAWQSALSKMVAPSDLPLYSVATSGANEWQAVYIEHFSAPTDADNHFVETPLLSLPDMAEEYTEADEWEAGDWFIVTKYVADTQDEKRGTGPFQAQTVNEDGVWTSDDVLYLYAQIRPCPAPESTQSVPVERSVIPLPGSAGGSVTLPLRYDTHDRIVPLD